MVKFKLDMRRYSLGILWAFFFLSSCGQNRNVEFFKETEAYELAKAVGDNDTSLIEKLVKEKPDFLKMTNYHTGADALDLALYLENYEAFKKLLDLGADPNSINPLTKRTPLIEACRYYEKPEDWTIDLRYIQLLLERGADPNYVIDSNFLNNKRNGELATSALHEASSIDLSMVKLLIKYGGNPMRKLQQNKATPFAYSLQGGKIPIINYYIDSLKVNVHETLMVVKQSQTNEMYQFKIQDLIINKYLLAKIKRDTLEIQSQLKDYPKLEAANIERWELIKKLESMSVDFKNYKYRE